MSRIHIAITTTDVARAIPFYETLFGTTPVKVRDGYAKFDVAEPSVNFTLNAAAEGEAVGHRGSQHFGIQVSDTATVTAAKERLEAAGLPTRAEDNVTCCYAVQDKIWAVDPDGHRWEVFVTHADADVHSIPQSVATDVEVEDEAPCCAPSCCK